MIAATRANPKLPGVRLDASIGVTNDIARCRARRCHPDRDAGAAFARGRHGARASSRAGNAGHRLRQGHRARHAPIHDRGDRRSRARGDPGDPVGSEFCRRRGARPADRGDARGKDEALAGALVQALGSATFRPYHTTDVRGVEIGGAAKNVLAIAAGIVVGRKLGASAQAALTTRGFSELVRLGRACGARSETMAGLSGLGDLILTCSSPQSRNFALGIALGRGEQPPTRQARRRRIHRTGADRTGGFEKCRYAGIKCGGGDPERRRRPSTRRSKAC